MKKFTKIEEQQNTGPAGEKSLYKSDYFNIVEKDGWQFDACPNDYVIAIIYLANHMELVFRLETVVPFKQKHPEFDRFVTTVSGTKEIDESFEECLFREIYEETGIVISKSYNDYQLIHSLFISKGTTCKFHFYWVPITDSDYRLEKAPGDGSNFEANATAFRINLGQLKTLKPVDMTTAMAIEIAKNELAIS